MTISKKILNEISNLEKGKKYKTLLIDLLNVEDSGNHRNNKQFEKMVNEYISKNGDVE